MQAVEERYRIEIERIHSIAGTSTSAKLLDRAPPTDRYTWKIWIVASSERQGA
jgi:hypothetical protein